MTDKENAARLTSFVFIVDDEADLVGFITVPAQDETQARMQLLAGIRKSHPDKTPEECNAFFALAGTENDEGGVTL